MQFQPFHDDETLMQEICLGNRRAFETLYGRYFDKLTWFARSFIADVQQAEDVVQEIFLRIIERPEQFDSGRRFSTWVYAATANACKNHLRNKQTRNRLLEIHLLPRYAAGTQMHHETDFRMLQERIRKAFDQLSEKEKNIFVLRFEHERSIKEIAEILEMPEGSVKSGLFYLLKKFATQLKEFTHEN